MKRINNQDLGFPDVEEILTLALEAPDDELIMRYLYGGRSREHAELNRDEQRWVSTNIRYNPQWKFRATALASANGLIVSEPSHPFRTHGEHRPPAGAPPATRRRGVFVSARAFAATVGLLFVGYAAVVFASNASMSAAERLGSVRPMISDLEAGARDVHAMTYNMDHGVTHLLEAERRFAGIFLGFDEIHTRGAVVSLRRAYNENGDPFHRAEVAYFLGKAYLMQGDTFRAREWLQTSLDQRVIDYHAEVLALEYALRSVDP